MIDKLEQNWCHTLDNYHLVRWFQSTWLISAHIWMIKRRITSVNSTTPPQTESESLNLTVLRSLINLAVRNKPEPVISMKITVCCFYSLNSFQSYFWVRHQNILSLPRTLAQHPTSNSNLELPKLVLCFCQKLSGLMIRATWIQEGNDSWRIFSRGLMLSHLEPRMSTMTVKPCLATSSLQKKRK